LTDDRVRIKRAFSLGTRDTSAKVVSVQSSSDDPKLSELVKVYAAESDTLELGESIPLIDIGDEKFELVVE
jgi:hypothetical protein